jgi:SHAQKYF class myb-like DNA-binding protein
MHQHSLELDSFDDDFATMLASTLPAGSIELLTPPDLSNLDFFGGDLNTDLYESDQHGTTILEHGSQPSILPPSPVSTTAAATIAQDAQPAQPTTAATARGSRSRRARQPSSVPTKRFVWTDEYIRAFEQSVRKLGSRAGPTAIAGDMGIAEITEVKVRSRLQKYRKQQARFEELGRSDPPDQRHGSSSINRSSLQQLLDRYCTSTTTPSQSPSNSQPPAQEYDAHAHGASYYDDGRGVDGSCCSTSLDHEHLPQLLYQAASQSNVVDALITALVEQRKQHHSQHFARSLHPSGSMCAGAGCAQCFVAHLQRQIYQTLKHNTSPHHHHHHHHHEPGMRFNHMDSIYCSIADCPMVHSSTGSVRSPF